MSAGSLPRRPAKPIGSYRLRSDGRYHRTLLAEHDYTKSWGQLADGMIRLALAVRDADGSQLIEPSALEDLPGMRDTVAELARRTGLLAPVSPADLEFRRPRHGPDPRHHDGRPAQNCDYCLDWGIGSVCANCLAWAGRARGTCSGCQRPGVPLRRRRCRSCELRAGQKGPPPAQIQLAMHGPWTRGHRAHAAGQVSDSPETGGVCEHLLCAGQLTLADARRD